ncbi:MAG TPA: restriction endonuclease subunit S, partial [Clostridiales bacterium]|nr:restriction endonuclease subunit S [Clostridiales bacterium]
RLLKELKIPIPPLAEQKRIVAILDEAFSAISTAKENAEKNLKNAKELFDSYLNNIFEMKGKDWEEKKLGEVLQKTETINPTLEPDKEFVYIDVSSVNNETLTIENSSVIIGKSAPSRARKLVKTNDIIFATIRPTLKRIAIVSEEFHNQVCSTGYFVLRAKPFLNYQMLFYYLLTNKFDSQMEKLQKGASYPAVTDGDVRNQVIPFPPLKEQQRIVAKLDALSEQTKQLEAVYSKKIADLDELKKSILQKAFRGEL